MNRKLNCVVRILILVGMLIGAALIVFAVRYMTTFSSYSFTDGDLSRAYVTGCLAIACVVGCEFIAFTLYRMMCSLTNDPFMSKTSRRCGAWALPRWQ